MSEKKVVRKSVAIGLGIICIVLVSGLVGAFAYYHYTPMINHNDNTISSLNAEISQLNSTILGLQEQLGAYNLTINSLKTDLTNLQEQLNELLNGTITPIGIITSNPSAWVNKTVEIQGTLTELPFIAYVPWQIPPPWNYWLNSSSNGIDQIGVLWNGSPDVFSQVQISGVVRQGIENLNGTSITVFYIEASTINPFASYINATLGTTP